MGVARIHQRTLFSLHQKGSGTNHFILPHLPTMTVLLLEVFHELCARMIDEQPADAAERLGYEELDLGVWLVLFRGGGERRLRLANESPTE